MLTETIPAGLLLICLVLFFPINLHNVLVVHQASSAVRSYSEVSRPSSVALGLDVLGTTTHFFEASLYPILVLTNAMSKLSILKFSFPKTGNVCLLNLGLLLTAVGSLLVFWRVNTRANYATSWETREKHKLATCGPHWGLRQPFYPTCFLTFIELLATLPSWLTLMLLVSIPRYLSVSIQKDKLLEKRFGHKYPEYRRRADRSLLNLRTRRGEKQNG
jgi:protein-S-isoprenylcysteine O-methyltransferase Ste14